MNQTPLVIILLAIASTHIEIVSSQCTSTGSGCLSATSNYSCQGRPDGDYQACEGCSVYHSCSGGVLWANRLCPLDLSGVQRLLWRALSYNSGRCDYSSSTCRECASSPSSGGCNTETQTSFHGCITQLNTSCLGKPDGDYQACERCTVFHSCSGGVTWANRPCPACRNDTGLRGYLVWNAQEETKGYCEYTSQTCKECSVNTDPQDPGNGGGPGCSTGSSCITQQATSCNGKPDGDYQACEGCTMYHSCSNGQISANRPCARRTDGTQLVWVTESLGRGHCDFSSTTCVPCK